MDRKEAFHLALSNGVLLSPQAVELTKDELMSLITKTKAKGGLVVQPEAVRITQRTVRAVQMTSADYVKYYVNKYNALKAILDRKLPDSVAINKLSTGHATIVAMIRGGTDKGFMAEDPTGQIEVVAKEQPEQDVVVGITGYVRAGKLWAEQLIWPDVPLTHTPSTLPGLTAILKGRTIQIDDHSLTITTTPTWITVSRESQHVNILVYQTENPQPRQWLRYRHLNPSPTDINSTDDVWLLEPIPDIIWLLTEKPFYDVYRGVVIFSPGSEAVRLDLSNMTIIRDCTAP